MNALEKPQLYNWGERQNKPSPRGRWQGGISFPTWRMGDIINIFPLGEEVRAMPWQMGHLIRGGSERSERGGQAARSAALFQGTAPTSPKNACIVTPVYITDKTAVERTRQFISQSQPFVKRSRQFVKRNQQLVAPTLRAQKQKYITI